MIVVSIMMMMVVVTVVAIAAMTTYRVTSTATGFYGACASEAESTDPTDCDA